MNTVYIKPQYVVTWTEPTEGGGHVGMSGINDPALATWINQNVKNQTSGPLTTECDFVTKKGHFFSFDDAADAAEFRKTQWAK